MPTDKEHTSQVGFPSNWKDNQQYFEMLILISKLSGLFSDNTAPYISYRFVENWFCRAFNAINDARQCTAYDARIQNLGIGIKTFLLRNNNFEKVAEFNKLRSELDKYTGKALAVKLAEYRNERILFANRLYGVQESLYHIVTRSEGKLVIFNHEYPLIDISSIGAVKSKRAGSIAFSDGQHEYTFNNSKSVLWMNFVPPQDKIILEVDILADPFEVLLQWLSSLQETPDTHKTKPTRVKGRDYVILPLYSTRNKNKEVPRKSGLNQWNASGRKRAPDEVYIPIPASIHKKYPSFFPNRDTPFELELPNGEQISVKVCQENGKALMSNPNVALGKWILRDVLQLDEWQLVTVDTLNKFGVDSLIIEKNIGEKGNKDTYKIFFQNEAYETYDEFMDEGEVE